MTEQERAQVVDHFDTFFTTLWDPNQPPGPVHPSQLQVSKILDHEFVYAERVNKVERHSDCRKDTCLRKIKHGIEGCCFKYPFNLEQTTRLVDEREPGDDKGRWILYCRSNSPRVNRHSRFVLQSWRANIDVLPIVGRYAVANHGGKYASNSEPRSATYAKILRHIINNATAPAAPALKVMQKLPLRSVLERDISIFPPLYGCRAL